MMFFAVLAKRDLSLRNTRNKENIGRKTIHLKKKKIPASFILRLCSLPLCSDFSSKLQL